MCQTQSVQDCQTPLAVLDRPYNKETETTSEITLPPPSPPQFPQNSGSEVFKEEEEFKILVGEWNTIIQRPLASGQDIILTPKRKQALHGLLVFLRQTDLTWAAFCQKIASSRFLMGQNDTGFRVSFDWAINLNNALKICENTFYDKPQTAHKTRLWCINR